MKNEKFYSSGKVDQVKMNRVTRNVPLGGKAAFKPKSQGGGGVKDIALCT